MQTGGRGENLILVKARRPAIPRHGHFGGRKNSKFPGIEGIPSSSRECQERELIRHDGESLTFVKSVGLLHDIAFRRCGQLLLQESAHTAKQPVGLAGGHFQKGRGAWHRRV